MLTSLSKPRGRSRLNLAMSSRQPEQVGGELQASVPAGLPQA